ncbi:MAG TPA: hydrogenase maturation nickel metallochaperone HypA, partial [bacterium]
MHEPAIAAELIESARNEIAQAGYLDASVSSITIRVGALRGVDDESLQLAFDVLKLTTPFSKATLVIEHSPV